MADLKISELSALAGANLVAADELAIVDDSASETKKITVSDLIANGVTLISDDTIPGAKILFGAGDVSSAAIADSAVATAKIADDAVTAAKLADESTVDLVTTLPASGAFTGQLALDTDDNNLYLWDGSAWQNIVAPGSVNTVSGSTTGEINIVASTSGSTVTISATIDNTTSAAQFLAGPTGSGGTVGYRTIVGTDLPVATTSDKGGVVVNGNGLVMDGDTLEIDNTVTSSATHHVVTYDANGLITGGRVIASADLPIATNAAVGGVIAGTGLTVDVTGNLSIDNSVTPGTYTKVTVTSEGVISAGDTLAAADIPDHSAAKLTSGTIGTSLIANDAITSDKMADQSTTKFGGAAGSDNVTIFPTGDFKGQFFYDETTQDLYIYTGSSFVPITVLSGNLVNAGAYNASTNQMSSVTSAGSSAGFSVGAALPAPAQTNLNHYVVVDTSGTGTGAAPAVALAPPDMLLSQGVGTEYSLIDVSNAIAGQTASNISLIATGNIIATDVQAGIQELDSEKLAKAGDTMTGALGIGTASSIVFEGSTADDYETTLTVTDPTADRTITFPDVTGNVVTTGDTGTVTSTMILDNTIVNADINASAEIAVSKLADGAARQLLQTDAAGTGVEWASNIDIPGTLDVTSTATFDSTVTVTGLITANGKVSFPAGTAAAPGLYSGTDIDTGIYAPGANEFGIATAGSAALTIDSSQRVGIGTTSPSSPLTVEQSSANVNLELHSTSSGRGTQIKTHNDHATFYHGLTGDTSGNFIYYTADAKDHIFSTNNSERMRIDSSGNVGIGTTANADSQLHVKSGANDGNPVLRLETATNNFLNFRQTGSVYDIHVTAGDPLSFSIGASERMRIDSSGDVQARRARSNTAGDVALSVQPSDSTIHYGFRIDAANNSLNLDRTDNNSTFLTLDSNGNVGIGKSSDLFYRLTFAEGSGDASRIGWVSGSGNRKASIDCGNTAALVFRTDVSDTERMRIDSAGNLTFSQEAASNYPEQKLKWSNDSTTANGFYLSQDTTRNGRVWHEQGLDILFGTSNTERLRIDSSGRLLIGTTNGSITQAMPLQVEGTSFITSGASLRRNSNDAGAPALRLCKSRGTSTGSYSIVSNGDAIGLVQFCAADGNSDETGAEIRVEIDGTPGNNDIPSRLMFSTTADGASSPTERMRIRSSGLVSIPGVYSFTTAASANVIVQSAGQLSRATSSAKYKTSIETLEDSYADSILECRPVWYRSTSELDNPNYGWWGFIAEEVAEIDPRLVFWKTTEVTYEENGSAVESPCDPEPEGVAYDRFVPHLLNLIKRQKEQIETLEQRLTDAGL